MRGVDGFASGMICADGIGEPALVAIVRALASCCSAPVALVSLLDGDRTCRVSQPMLARAPLAPMHSHTPIVVRHAERQEAGAPFVSYLSAPLVSPCGVLEGTISVADTIPRDWSESEIAAMAALAASVVAHLQHRTAARAIDATFDGIAIVNTQGVFTYMNQAHATQFGYDTPAQLVGQRWTALCDEGGINFVQSVCFAAMERDGAWTGETIGKRRDGSLFDQEITLTKMPSGIICATRDISQRKRLEADRLRHAEMRATAETASAAKTAFLAQMSHEIRTPLNGVLGLASALAGTSLNQSQREIVDLIERSGEMLNRLLADMLDLSAIEAGKVVLQIAPFELCRAVEDVAELAAPRAREKRLSLTLAIDPAADAWFSGDVVRIKQMLLNLVTNAVKYTQTGEVRIRVRAPAGGVEIEVEDTGIGIDPAQSQRLFQPFERNGDVDAEGGVGLGLAISRSLATLMDGALSVRSAPGAGSVFTLVLPMPRAIAAQPDTAAGRETRKALRVLAAEDNATNRLVLKLLLEASGASVTFAENGADAVEAWRTQDFDVVLLDMLMPVMDGHAACRAIRAAEATLRRSHTPIAMLSANVMPEHQRAAMAAGVDAFVAKPLTGATLLDGVHRALSACRGRSEAQVRRA